MPLQMALDEILFREVEFPSAAPDKGSVIASEAKESPVFRIFFSSEPWVTVGYSTKDVILRPEGPKNLARSFASLRMTEKEVEPRVCRRITGGGVVHHGRDLIFSIVARKTDDESFRSVRLAYLKIHEAVKAAFEAGGMHPRFYRCDENLPRGRECFAFPIATDLALEGRKVAGGAQKRSSGVLLHQESIQDVQGLDLFDLAAGLRASFEKTFGIQFKPMDLDPGLLEKAKELAEGKYAPALKYLNYERT